MDMEKIMAYVEKIAENLEGLVCAIGCDSMPSDGAICVDGEQKVNYISTRESLRILDGFGNNSASESWSLTGRHTFRPGIWS